MYENDLYDFESIKKKTNIQSKYSLQNQIMILMMFWKYNLLCNSNLEYDCTIRIT